MNTATVQLSALTLDEAAAQARTDFCKLWGCSGLPPREWPFQIVALDAIPEVIHSDGSVAAWQVTVHAEE